MNRFACRLALVPAMVAVVGSSAAAQHRTARFSIEPERSSQTTPVRRAPVLATSFGGFATGTAALVGLLAATWDNPEGVSEPVVWAAYGLGTAAGAAVITSIWEKPNRGLTIGALAGAAPILLAATSSDDGAAGAAFLLAWIAAPVGAAIGQRAGRR